MSFPEPTILIQRAEKEWLEDGTIHTDTAIQLASAGLSVDEVIETFKEVERDHG